MTNFTVTIRGAAELDAKLGAAPQGAAEVLERGNAAAAPVVKVNIEDKTPVRKGILVGSEDVLVKGTELEFHAEAFYASFVARGTSKQRANPYDERGVAAAEPDVVQGFEAERDVFVSDFNGS